MQPKVYEHGIYVCVSAFEMAKARAVYVMVKIQVHRLMKPFFRKLLKR
jgi:hypothetical protein